MSLDLTLIAARIAQAQFDELAPDGGPLHFRSRSYTYLDPITKVDTGLQTRVVIANLAATHGWPLVGIFFSTSGGLIPHVAIHVSEFPAQTGAPGQKADKLQTSLLAALESVYKSEEIITDPTDPDFGQTVDVRSFFPQVHVWKYPALVPRAAVGVGDYQLAAFTNTPPGNWWQEL